MFDSRQSKDNDLKKFDLEMPAFQRVQDDIGHEDFLVLGISADKEGPEFVRDFLEELGAIIQEVAGDTDALRSVRTQVGSISEVAADAGLSAEDLEQVREAAEGITEQLGAVEEEILQTDNRSFYDPLDNPGKLNAVDARMHRELTVAGGLGVSADARPTDAAVERLQELRGEVGAVEETLERIFSEDLAAFNNLIRALGLQPVVLDRDRRLIS